MEQAGHQDRFRRLLRREMAATVELAVTRLTAAFNPPGARAPAGPDDVLDRFAAPHEDAGDPVEVDLVLAGLAASEDPRCFARCSANGSATALWHV